MIYIMKMGFICLSGFVIIHISGSLVATISKITNNYLRLLHPYSCLKHQFRRESLVGSSLGEQYLGNVTKTNKLMLRNPSIILEEHYSIALATM